MTIPQEVQSILDTLTTAGYEAYVVGGCVRDMLLGKEPKDWDVTTNATPPEIQRLFPDNFYTNQFGTVTVLNKSADAAVKEVEVTTYRIDTEYTDQRHPDKVEFTSSLTEDLARRDFTINALAAHKNDEGGRKSQEYAATIDGVQVIDPFGGMKDLNAKLIRAVGNPAERFTEDALRLMRAARFAAQLDFDIEEETLTAMTHYAESITAVSHERVRDELIKIAMSDHPEHGMNILQKTGILAFALPEIAEGVGIEQNKHHIYTVFEHNVKSLQYASKYGYPLHVRLAALLHDIGKPRTRRFSKEQGDYTFYGHDIVGARMAEALMKRLRFSSDMTKRVSHLVRQHMFYYDMDKVTEAGIRRMLRRIGPEHFDDLIKVRIAERKGSGVPKAEPYRLRHLQFMAEKVSQQPITVGQLAIRGEHLQKELGLTPGPIFGGILNALLAEVLEDPKKNTLEYLLGRAAELKDKNPDELKALGAAATREEEQRREDDIKRKYHV